MEEDCFSKKRRRTKKPKKKLGFGEDALVYLSLVKSKLPAIFNTFCVQFVAYLNGNGDRLELFRFVAQTFTKEPELLKGFKAFIYDGVNILISMLRVVAWADKFTEEEFQASLNEEVNLILGHRTVARGNQPPQDQLPSCRGRFPQKRLQLMPKNYKRFPEKVQRNIEKAQALAKVQAKSVRYSAKSKSKFEKAKLDLAEPQSKSEKLYAALTQTSPKVETSKSKIKRSVAGPSATVSRNPENDSDVKHLSPKVGISKSKVKRGAAGPSATVSKNPETDSDVKHSTPKNVKTSSDHASMYKARTLIQSPKSSPSKVAHSKSTPRTPFAFYGTPAENLANALYCSNFACSSNVNPNMVAQMGALNISQIKSTEEVESGVRRKTELDLLKETLSVVSEAEKEAIGWSYVFPKAQPEPDSSEKPNTNLNVLNKSLSVLEAGKRAVAWSYVLTNQKPATQEVDLATFFGEKTNLYIEYNSVIDALQIFKDYFRRQFLVYSRFLNALDEYQERTRQNRGNPDLEAQLKLDEELRKHIFDITQRQDHFLADVNRLIWYLGKLNVKASEIDKFLY